MTYTTLTSFTIPVEEKPKQKEGTCPTCHSPKQVLLFRGDVVHMTGELFTCKKCIANHVLPLDVVAKSLKKLAEDWKEVQRYLNGYMFWVDEQLVTVTHVLRRNLYKPREEE